MVQTKARLTGLCVSEPNISVSLFTVKLFKPHATVFSRPVMISGLDEFPPMWLENCDSCALFPTLLSPSSVSLSFWWCYEDGVNLFSFCFVTWYQHLNFFSLQDPVVLIEEGVNRKTRLIQLGVVTDNIDGNVDVKLYTFTDPTK